MLAAIEQNMCLIVFAYQQHPDYPLILVANRDEFYVRPTESMQFWQDHPTVLAGRDLQQMGTWLGINQAGHFAAVTNVRDGRHIADNLLSRGDLTKGFLTTDLCAAEYLNQLKSTQQSYGLFNLLIADKTGLYYFSNRGGAPQQLEPGLYGLSNAQLNTPWPKLIAAKQALQCAIQENDLSHDRLSKILASKQTADDTSLPDTGISYEWEKRLSSAFIHSSAYGTRATTTLIQATDGTTELNENNFDVEGVTEQKRFIINVPALGSHEGARN